MIGNPTAFTLTCIEAQTQKNRNNNSIVTLLVTEDNCIAVCYIAKEIGVALLSRLHLSKSGESAKTTRT